MFATPCFVLSPIFPFSFSCTRGCNTYACLNIHAVTRVDSSNQTRTMASLSVEPCLPFFDHKTPTTVNRICWRCLVTIPIFLSLRGCVSTIHSVESWKREELWTIRVRSFSVQRAVCILFCLIYLIFSFFLSLVVEADLLVLEFTAVCPDTNAHSIYLDHVLSRAPWHWPCAVDGNCRHPPWQVFRTTSNKAFSSIFKNLVPALSRITFRRLDKPTV